MLIIAVLLGVGGFFYYRFSHQPPPIVDKQTWCPEDKRIPAQITILIDQTDSLKETQIKSIKSKVLDLVIGNKPSGIAGLPKYGRVELYVMSGSASANAPILTLCNPGDGSDVSELTGNPVLAARRWRQRFEEPFSRALDQTVGIGTADHSPILETLQAINIDVANKLRQAEDLQWRRLVIVSDMLQHTEFSLYRGVPAFSDFARTPHFRRLYSDLSGSGVSVLLVHRPAQQELGTQKFQDFWANLFGAFNADSRHFEWQPVEG